MRYLAAFLVCLIAPLSALAQDAHSPQELATQIKALIETADTNSTVRLIHSSAEAASVERFKSTLVAYVGSTNLKVYPISKDDQKAVREFLANLPTPSSIKPLEERVKKFADNGWIFQLEPLGDLVISGKRVGAPSSESITSVVYGEQDGKYLVIFVRRK